MRTAKNTEKALLHRMRNLPSEPQP